jgi:hypothetical protein
MEAARTSETSVDNHFTRQYNPEDSSEHHTRRRENLKSHLGLLFIEENAKSCFAVVMTAFHSSSLLIPFQYLCWLEHSLFSVILHFSYQKS